MKSTKIISVVLVLAMVTIMSMGMVYADTTDEFTAIGE